ncbi:MAG: hypothetical protein AB7E52_04345 [Bdellovibrionales bacterium]
MKKLCLALLFVCLSSPALAGGKCYTVDEVQAERLIRLHSELMVITLTCKQGSTGRDLVRAYTGFTQRHIRSLEKAEKILSHYYAQTYGGNGISRLDKLRTRLANEYGQQSANASAPVFCARLRDKVTSMYDSLSPSVLEQAVQGYKGIRSSEPVCDKSLNIARNNDAEPLEKADKVLLSADRKIKKGGKS